jgi:hypothetical protein
VLFDITKTAVCALLVASVLATNGCGGGSSTPPTPTGTTVTVSFKGATPAAVAEQIGTGPWTAASPQGGQLSLTLPQGETRYAIAFVCSFNGLFNSESVIEVTTQDPVPTRFCGFPPPVPLTLQIGAATGSVDASAIPGTSSVLIYGLLGRGSVAGVSGAFNLQMLQGTDDIAFVALDVSLRVLAVKILRSQTVPGAVNGGQTVVLAAGDEATYQTISVTSIPPGFTGDGPSALYATAKGTLFPVAPLFFSTGSRYAVVPASEAQASDQYRFSASGLRLQPPPSGCTNQFFEGQQFVGVNLSAASASAVTLPLPAPLAYSPPTPAAFPSFDVSYTGFNGDSGVNYSIALNWGRTTGSLAPFSDVNVTATAAYQNGATTLSIPDLTGLTGFLARPNSGAMVAWSAGLSEHSPQPTDSSATAANSGCYVAP